MLIKTTRAALFGGLISLALLPAVWTAALVYGPGIEREHFPPVASVVMEPGRCAGPDLMVRGVVNKNDFDPDPDNLRLFEILIVDGEALLPVRSHDHSRGREQLVSRSPGQQGIGSPELPLQIFGGCGREYIIHTRHRSILRVWSIDSHWGPFR